MNEPRSALLLGDSQYAYGIAGDDREQNALKLIAGDRTEEAKEHECIAFIARNFENEHDPNVMPVFIDGMQAGFISPIDTPTFRLHLEQMHGSHSTNLFWARALIGGGGESASHTENLSVKLDVCFPLESVVIWDPNCPPESVS
jgi:hypothetical protein